MGQKKGHISVNTQDIFPIIKKWLYSEHDIFLRELISNSSDAITKRSTLSRLQNIETPIGKITVAIDKNKKTLTISDNGLGMTEEEVEKYIAQLAFSGAEEFVNKMKDTGDLKEDIIGKFGLGFYSAFMVADKVEIDTLSFKEDSTATKWTCDGETEYEFSESERTEVGTSITLFINEESADFLETYKTRVVVKKYCEFMPYKIHMLDVNEFERILEENKKAEKEEDKKPLPEDIINKNEPLWKKDPTTLKDEDYKAFYQELFPFQPEPLFWLHLNVDHPFELQGVLFFPKVDRTKPMSDNNIKLYSKQVFVSDNVKNIIPEFLGLLKGTIDSSDIPLNVSRSSLQGDPNIQKISNYIIKKVAESLKKLFKSDRERFETVWDDIALFVKYGAVSDTKFDELIRPYTLLKTTDGKCFTFEEYAAAIPETFKEKLENKVIYVEEANYDSSLAKKFENESIPLFSTDTYIDPHFMQHVEFQSSAGTKVSFTALDTEFENLFATETSEENKEIQTIFEDVLSPKDDKEKESFSVELKTLGAEDAPVYLKIDEQSKRMQKMTQSMGQDASMFPLKTSLVVNPTHPLIQKVAKLWGSEKKELAGKICFHLKDLANISQGQWDQKAKADFINRSQEIIQELI